MKSFRIFPLAVIALSLFASCDENKDNDLEVVDSVRLSVSFKNPDLDLLWGEDWKTDWQYDWDSSDTTYGTLGYSTPEIFKGTIYNLDANTGKRYSNFFKLFGLNENLATLPSGGKYDMLLYNTDTENIIFQASDDFEKYTASTTITPFGFDSLGVPYKHLDEPDELLGALVTGVDLSKPSTDSMEIDVELNPFSIIYLIQVVLLNNDDVNDLHVTGARDISVSGLSQGVELFTRKTFDKTLMITTEDVKPLRNHSNVRLEDGTVVDNADILAARMLTWGLPGINPMDSSKYDPKASASNENYIMVTLTLSNGRPFCVTKEVTDQMHSKPAGGVITVSIDTNEIDRNLTY
ncbi:MAG: DUF5119 domain-containing protein [Bacteroidaceae bacterium]|nr:DUF5119 domain-containing protein [Bacteroidaceae bacterium]